ncbi:Na+/H+ antiporter NhaC [Crassaminicella profunda]|uniref:Na+/H+ antiporter NhaC n=1 Tax=Crassaminicella profunda TaxID=1286698 RepID=UPI001CA62D75|nr:Na+/H+ antiporter NhaC [Crassaminicella profunda]QZY56515.1 Na+/H+ antiporter NhaC [Crassaminicella profunda]
MEKGKRLPLYIEAIAPFIMLVLLVAIGYIYLELRIEFLLILATIFAGLIAKRLGYTWSEMEDAIGDRLKKVTQAILIMWSVGIIIGTFMFSGSIPFIISLSLKIINPQYLFVFSFIICVILSVVTGTAWGSVGTAGVAMMGVAVGLGLPVNITAGAVIAGSIFGDKMSPLSDTTNLSAASAGVDLYDHIKQMLYTTVPATIISLIVYLIVGLNLIESTSGLPETAVTMINNLDQMYNWNVLMILPLVVVFGGAFLKKPTVPTMIFASILAIAVGVFVNGFTIQNGVASAIFGFKASMVNVAGFDSNAISIEVIKLINRGGMRSMIGIITIIYCGYSFTAILSKTKCLEIMLQPVVKVVKTRGQVMLATVISSILLACAAGTSYVPTIMIPEMFRKLFIQTGMKLNNLSRTLEDAGTCVNPLIPWGMSGIFYATTFNMNVVDYAPWAMLCWMTPILAIIYGFTGFGIAKLNDEEQKALLKKVS